MSSPSNWPLPTGSSRVVLPHETLQQLRKHPISMGLYPIAFGHYLAAHGHSVTRQKHTDYLLIFCHDGEGILRTNASSVTLSAGQLVLLPKGVSHHYHALSTSPWSIYWCHFSGNQAADYMDYLVLNTGIENPTQQPHASVITMERWRQLLPDVTELLNLQHQRWQLDRGLLAAHILQKLLVHLPLLATQQETRVPFALSTIERYMSDHLHQSLSLAELAQFAGYSTYHFSKKFRRATGTSPLKYFLELKVQHACRLLDNTTDSVRDIATALGIDDPYYFSRLFKKTMGIAPQHYRALRHGDKRT